jgi:hypothetical protein
LRRFKNKKDKLQVIMWSQLTKKKLNRRRKKLRLRTQRIRTKRSKMSDDEIYYILNLFTF